jgi:NAD(P)-dependent dehydrogenase (short-subunit alcohol dehydrogenase family)
MAPAPPTSLLAGRRALVTGAAGAIGASVVDAFTAHGATVIGLDAREAAGVERCDVTDEEAVADAFERHAPIDHVVHAAGIVATGDVAQMAVSEFRRVIEVNLLGSFIVAREAARRLSGGSTITLVSSQAGRKGGAGWSAYCASKFGVIGLAESLAQELAPSGVRVNVVCPGAIDTGMTSTAIEQLAILKQTTPEEERRRYEQAIPAGRLGRAEEVASACAMLASPFASFVVGASLVVDGGELS